MKYTIIFRLENPLTKKFERTEHYKADSIKSAYKKMFSEARFAYNIGANLCAETYKNGKQVLFIKTVIDKNTESMFRAIIMKHKARFSMLQFVKSEMIFE